MTYFILNEILEQMQTCFVWAENVCAITHRYCIAENEMHACISSFNLPIFSSFDRATSKVLACTAMRARTREAGKAKKRCAGEM